MDPFLSETDDDSPVRSQMAFVKLIRKRKIRLTQELNNDTINNTPPQGRPGKRTKKISNSILPPIDNISLVPKVVLQRDSTRGMQDKKHLLKFKMNMIKVENSKTKGTKPPLLRAKRAVNSVDYSDYFRKCSVFLTRLTDKQIEDALGKDNATFPEEIVNHSKDVVELEDKMIDQDRTAEEQSPSIPQTADKSDALNVTFEIVEEEVKTCKSILLKNSIRSPDSISHRVTFHNTTMVRDNCNTTSTVPTRFPSDDEDEPVTVPVSFGTPIKTTAPHLRDGVSTPVKTSTPLLKNGLGTPIKTSTPLLKNGLGTLAITSTPQLKNASKKPMLPILSKLKAAGTPTKMQNPEKKVFKRGVMPDYAKIHQKMYDKMLNIQEYKDQKLQRAQLLMSGRKPNSPKKPDPQPHTPVKKEVQKKLNFARLAPSKDALNSKTVPNNKTPTRRREQELSIKNKNHSGRKSMENIRTEIKGMRTNRRFELLMKFRRGQ